jgi:hypothetical protein
MEGQIVPELMLPWMIIRSALTLIANGRPSLRTMKFFYRSTKMSGKEIWQHFEHIVISVFWILSNGKTDATSILGFGIFVISFIVLLYLSFKSCHFSGGFALIFHSFNKQPISHAMKL